MNVGLGYTLPKDWSVNAKYYTNSSMTSTFQNANNVNGQKLYKNAFVASLTKTFE
jgi:predicted phage gp36 major capsid-like protein